MAKPIPGGTAFFTLRLPTPTLKKLESIADEQGTNRHRLAKQAISHAIESGLFLSANTAA